MKDETKNFIIALENLCREHNASMQGHIDIYIAMERVRSISVNEKGLGYYTEIIEKGHVIIPSDEVNIDKIVGVERVD